MRLGTMELLLIFGLALLIFGPTKLPELGKTLGKAIGGFKSEVNKVTEEINDVVKDDSNDKEEE